MLAPPSPNLTVVVPARQERLMFRNAGLLIGKGHLLKGLGQLDGSIVLGQTHSLQQLLGLYLGKYRGAAIG